MIYYAEVSITGTVVQCIHTEFVIVPPEPSEGCTLHALAAPINWAAPTKSARLMWADGAAVWVDTRVLADEQAAALDKPRADINAVVWDAVGNLTEEYKDAEVDARAYKAGGYVGTAPRSVASFARNNPTGIAQTGQWAADDIIMRAGAFAVAKLAMRENRFARQSEMRAATTLAQLDAAVTAWNGFITQLRAQLGL
jgi:hypothetical protein